MPRTTPLRIDGAPVINSSQSSNIPLQPSQLGNPLSAGSTLRGVAAALNGIGSETLEIARQGRLRRLQEQKEQEQAQQKQDEQDASDGKAAAEERAVTGKVPDLVSMSDTARRSYQQVDGVRVAGDFETQLMPKLAKLEPGEDVDGFIRNEATSYAQNANMPPETSRVFMAAVAHQQEGWKQGYLRQSIAESLHRDVESMKAVAVDGFRKGTLFTPEGYETFRTLALHKGLSDEDVQDIIATSAPAAMSDGKTDIGRMQAFLRTIKVGEDGGTLADVPEYKQNFDLGAWAV
ncbi:hypothetical protein, partial [Frateuria defendens]|uniref:hypothetical protein n=1 Tax=Frateuria defendens TaxID=2219559 RepID=UPI00066FC97F